MRICLRFPALAILGALLIVTAAAGAASAATKKFMPLDFTPTNAEINVIRSPIGVGCGSSSASFAAPLGLPAGATITGIRFYSNGSGTARSAGVSGYFVNTSNLVAWVQSTDLVTSLDTPALTTGTLAAGPHTLTPNSLYSVTLNCSPNTAIWGVEIDYTP